MKPDHPEMLSLRSQIDELSGRSRANRRRCRRAATTALLADYRGALSAEAALQAGSPG